MKGRARMNDIKQEVCMRKVVVGKRRLREATSILYLAMGERDGYYKKMDTYWMRQGGGENREAKSEYGKYRAGL